MKIIADRGDKKIAYIQKRDKAYIKQFYSQNVEYQDRNGDFILITDEEVIDELEKMDSILSYNELMSLSKKQLDKKYREIKDLYTAKNSFKNEQVQRLDDLQDLYSETPNTSKSTFAISTDPLFYALEQLREFILIRQGKSNLSIPIVIMRRELEMELLNDYKVYGTTDPKTIVLIHKQGKKIEPEQIDQKSIMTAIWFNYARHNNLYEQQVFYPEDLETSFVLSQDKRCLYMKTTKKEKNNVKETERVLVKSDVVKKKRAKKEK